MKNFLTILMLTVVLTDTAYSCWHKSNNAISKYSKCELGDLVGDDVQRIKFQKFNIDYHQDDFTKAQIDNFAQKCVDEGVKNQYQMDCCMVTKMYPEN